MTWSVPIVQSLELLRRRLNAILGEAQALSPGYGDALPDVSDQPDARYFTLTTAQEVYQVQDGAWVKVS